MARHQTFSLTDEERAVRDLYLPRLRSAMETGQPVAVDFIKRDGTQRTVVGPVTDIHGVESTQAAVVETENGPRSANTYRITGMRFVR